MNSIVKSLQIDFDDLIKKMDPDPGDELFNALESFMNDLELCACTDHSAVIIVIKCLMRAYLMHHAKLNLSFNDTEELFELSEAEIYLGLTILEKQGWVEHGSNLRSSWLTGLGEEKFTNHFADYVRHVDGVIMYCVIYKKMMDGCC